MNTCITGTAAGDPYVTRLVIRRPKDDRKFSGLVVAEPMHPAAAAAHAFEYNSLYIMDTGHIAVEIDTTGVEIISGFNPERYGIAEGGAEAGERDPGAGRRADQKHAEPDREPEAAQDGPVGHVGQLAPWWSTTCRRTRCSSRPT